MADEVPRHSVLDEQMTRILDAAEKALDGTTGSLEPSSAALLHAVLHGVRHVSHNRSNLRIDDDALGALHLRADALMPRLERLSTP